MEKLRELEVKAVLVKIRSSEKLFLCLKASISSSSPEFKEMQGGLEKYIRSKKRQFRFKLLNLFVKVALKKIASIFIAFIW